MPNAYLPREWVHDRSNEIGDTALTEQASLQRLLKEQRRLTRWLEENAGNLQGPSGGVAVYLFGVVARMFDLAGGRLRRATWEQVREAEKRVGAAAGGLLPFDDGFAERVRGVEWRAQPHILDEAIYSLFEREPDDEEAELDNTEAGKIFFLLWVATEVLDSNWRPGTQVELQSDYTFVPSSDLVDEDGGGEDGGEDDGGDDGGGEE